MTITFLIYIDAFRHDYVSKTYTPFLESLSRKGFFSQVKTVPGFMQETAIMTGKYPDETGHFTWFRYDPERSPFGYLRHAGFLNHLRKSRLYYPIKVGIRTLTRVAKGEIYPDPAFIPINLLPYFQNVSVSLPQNMPNLFSLCRQSGRNYFAQTLIYDFVGTVSFHRLFGKVLRSINEGNLFDFYFLHIGELDGLGHRYGPHAELFGNYLKDIDSWIQKVYTCAVKRQVDCNLVITSDHAMFDVKGIVNIERFLKQLPLVCPKDYFYFLDSTLARFWFSSARAKQLVEEALSTIPHGHFLSEKEKTDMHIKFTNQQYGELMFWLDKGYIIFPNFFQTNRLGNTRGMHGYTSDNEGGLIVYPHGENTKNPRPTEVIPLVDVFSIVRCLAGF